MLQEKPNLIVAFNADDRCPYNVVSQVMEELKKANAVRVSFTSDPETSTQPSRRK
jgi:biopolymer transport protein ExbD